MTILTQYRQWRQSRDEGELYRLADRLDLLSDHERHVGSIHPVRQGQVARRIESQLCNPERVLANAIYLKLYETGAQATFYSLGWADDVLTTYCQLASKRFWCGGLSDEENEWIAEIDELEETFGLPLSDAIDEAIAQYFGNRGGVAA